MVSVKRLTPILNVSNIVESFAWFEKLGWAGHRYRGHNGAPRPRWRGLGRMFLVVRQSLSKFRTGCRG